MRTSAANYLELRPKGELDALRAQGLRVAFDRLTPGSSALVDLTSVTFIDSTGVGAIIGGVRRAREAGGELVVFGPRPGIARILRMTGVTKVVRLAPDRETALRMLDGAAPD